MGGSPGARCPGSPDSGRLLLEQLPVSKAHALPFAPAAWHRAPGHSARFLSIYSAPGSEPGALERRRTSRTGPALHRPLSTGMMRSGNGPAERPSVG